MLFELVIQNFFLNFIGLTRLFMSVKKQSLCIEWEQYESYQSLDEISKDLYLKARDISQKAYAPYSGFQVGAAILLKNGHDPLAANPQNDFEHHQS